PVVVRLPAAPRDVHSFPTRRSADLDRAPTVTYWTAVWRAHGDRVKLRQADAALVAATSTSRAAAIRATRPFGVDTAPLATGDARSEEPTSELLSLPNLVCRLLLATK